MQIFKHLSRHIFNRILALFVQSEKLSHFFFCFVIWIEVHFCLFLKFFPGFILVLPPRSFLLVLEECWFFFFNYFFFLSHFLIEFGLSNSLFCHLLLKQIKVAKLRVVASSLLKKTLTSNLFISKFLLWTYFLLLRDWFLSLAALWLLLVFI